MLILAYVTDFAPAQKHIIIRITEKNKYDVVVADILGQQTKALELEYFSDSDPSWLVTYAGSKIVQPALTFQDVVYIIHKKYPTLTITISDYDRDIFIV
ncbi:MAG: hypothetical protein LBP59_11220 [Planctomycetaceae bacterium]|nr:hypothetical protein [Planctomycetaceae bacterium]